MIVYFFLASEITETRCTKSSVKHNIHDIRQSGFDDLISKIVICMFRNGLILWIIAHCSCRHCVSFLDDYPVNWKLLDETAYKSSYRGVTCTVSTKKIMWPIITIHQMRLSVLYVCRCFRSTSCRNTYHELPISIISRNALDISCDNIEWVSNYCMYITIKNFRPAANILYLTNVKVHAVKYYQFSKTSKLLHFNCNVDADNKYY